MTITRADVAAYLHSQYARLAAEIKQAETDDSADGYGPDIDQALRKLGVPRAGLPAATVRDDQEEPLFALARYFALRRFAAQVTTKVDMDGGFGVQGGRSGVFRSVLDMLKEARAELVALGYLPPDSGSGSGGNFGVIDLNLDFLEPEMTGP